MTFEFTSFTIAAGLTRATEPGPTDPATAALVRELFAEGTLSWRQLREMASQPELAALLADSVAGVPAHRRRG